MKHLKSYRIFESINIELEKKLKIFNIINYVLNDNGSIDVNGIANLSNSNLNKIPFKFNEVSGGFIIRGNRIASLKNCPKYVSSHFDCPYNQLTSLEYGPEYVGGFYYCYFNKLITLKGCVEDVYDSFNCQDNQLTSLEFCPMQVEGLFNCSRNKLTELDRSPFIRRNLICTGMFKIEPEFNGHCEELIWR